MRNYSSLHNGEFRGRNFLRVGELQHPHLNTSNDRICTPYDRIRTPYDRIRTPNGRICILYDVSSNIGPQDPIQSKNNGIRYLNGKSYKLF